MAVGADQLGVGLGQWEPGHFVGYTLWVPRCGVVTLVTPFAQGAFMFVLFGVTVVTADRYRFPDLFTLNEMTLVTLGCVVFSDQWKLRIERVVEFIRQVGPAGYHMALVAFFRPENAFVRIDVVAT